MFGPVTGLGEGWKLRVKFLFPICAMFLFAWGNNRYHDEIYNKQSNFKMEGMRESHVVIIVTKNAKVNSVCS